VSAVTLGRIRSAILNSYGPHLDMSNFPENRPAEDLERCKISRGLAASYIAFQTGCSAEEAAATVTDGFDDEAIDAFKFDQMNDHLIIVSSKWSEKGKQGFNKAEVSKFILGLKKFLNVQLGSFNDRFKAREPEIKEALFCERQVKITLALVHNGSQPLSGHVVNELRLFAAEINDPVEICGCEDIHQSRIYDQITSAAKDPKIKLDVTLEDWGQITNPHLAYYGRVGVGQIAEWWNEHNSKLFTGNLRLFYRSSSVNDAMRGTLAKNARDFWYFNNGITLIADKITKGVAGTPQRTFGSFTCEGATIVNGAQTVGSIGEMLKDLPEDYEENSYVHVRLISLETCPTGYGASITRATNLQNQVGYREFAGMDATHHRLALDFALDGRKYAYRAGETDPVDDDGCTLTEATQALGCKVSIEATVRVKRNLGLIWAAMDQAPYTHIFPDNISAIEVWRSVKVMRAVERTLRDLKYLDGFDKAESVATHLNRIILHIVFKDPKVQSYLSHTENEDDKPDFVTNIAREKFEAVHQCISDNFSGAYLASVAKNTKRCEEIVSRIQDPSKDPSELDQYDLFKQAARDLKCDDDAERFNDALRKIATAPKEEQENE